MKTLLLIGGLHSLFFVLFHLTFWSMLRWKTQLKKLDDTNNAVMQILNLRLIFVFAFHALVCFGYPEEILNSTLGQLFLIGSGLFWVGRTIEQFVFRKFLPLNNPISISITILFVLGGVIYWIPLL